MRMMTAGLGRVALSRATEVSAGADWAGVDTVPRSSSGLPALSTRERVQNLEILAVEQYVGFPLQLNGTLVTPRDLILALLRANAGAPEIRWLEQALPQAGHGGLTQLFAAYTSASRMLGQAPLTSRSAAALAGDAIEELSLDRWTLEDAGRLLCLLEREAVIGAGDDFVADAVACYEQGDAREQASWLRGAALLPGAERFLAVVVDACRTNILTVFQAVACDNPYPARYFPDLNFNQMVLKALFNGVPLARVVGLQARANVDLARMATDYADERRAAGRSVPADLPLATVAAAVQRTR